MKRIQNSLLGLVMALFVVSGCHLDPSGIRIVQENDRFQLYIDGVPTYIKGVGGTNRLDIAAANGANAFRTWGGSVESIRRDVEQARTYGMYIMQGIGLTKDSALYFDESYKEKVRQEVRLLAETFKDEKQILAWGIGNEIDLGNANIGAAWSFVEELAQLIRSIDQRHLVSSVIAHNGAALDSIARFAPTLDFVGINSYGSIVVLEEMVNSSSYTGPFMVTEWGPSGFWEMPSTSWGAPIEQTSEEKRVVYEERYNNYIFSNPRCLGSFVFLWGQKEERTPTWFSMFVENQVEGLPLQGEKTPMVEAMQRVWTREEPTQTAPVILDFKMNGKEAIESVQVKAGESFEAVVSVYDREEDPLSYVWEILEEATILGFGGSYEPRPGRIGEVVQSRDPVFSHSLSEPGNYRLYVYVLDHTGFVSTTNIPFQVLKK
ncbi:MAG: hypothetical protein LUF85_16585 [Bacteroides sp.]|nr:hypothetical protein [Bacteroides sp.]